MSAIAAGLVLAAGATAASAASQPDAPDAPNLAAANEAGVKAQLAALPLQKQIEAAAKLGKKVLKEGFTSKQVSSNASVQSAQDRLSSLNSQLEGVPQTITETTSVRGQPTEKQVTNPAYTKLLADLKTAQSDLSSAAQGAGTEGQLTTVFYDNSGNPVSAKDAVLADFAGFSDIDQSRANLEFQGEAADKTAANALAVQQKYGPEFIAQRLKELELSDPIGFQARKDLGTAVSEDLGQGYELPTGLVDQIQQAERAGQAARGNVFGSAPAASEALKVGDAALRLRQQRLANVSSYLSGTTPVAQFASISGAQQGAAPYAPQNIQAGVGVDPNAGAQGAQFATQVYGQQSANAQNQANPWGSLLGSIAGAGVGSAAQGLAGLLKPAGTA